MLEVPHLMLHELCIPIVAMETEHFQLSHLLFVYALLVCALCQIVTTKHSSRKSIVLHFKLASYCGYTVHLELFN